MRKHLILKGKAVTYIDWANVHGWESTLKRDIDSAQIFKYLKTYPEIADVRMYAGLDTHPKSEEFLRKGEQIGYTVISKPVKYIFVAEVEGQKIYRRKCDFDMEICIDVHQALKDGIEGFVFFTGDGDFDPLYKMLIALRKQVIVVYASGHLGGEVWDIKRGLFKAQLKNLMQI